MRITDDWINEPGLQRVFALLTDAGHQALLVGGCVRNALLGAPVSDMDIATDARPETVLRLAKGSGIKAVPTGIDHGTVTLVENGIPHEVTTFRRDVATDGRRAVVAFADDVAEDARRRDFTMNALYARADGTVIDPLGGLPDLQARRVRFIEDPTQRIEEDYLRILRFFRFHAWYGDAQAGLDADALAAIATHLDGLPKLSRERVGAEMTKLLAAHDPAPAVAAMRGVGVLAAVLPGADDTALAPLVHLEGQHAISPDPMRRLAALGGHEVDERLRLSKANARRLAEYRAGLEADLPPAALGYRHGGDAARDILLLRAAMMGQPLDPLAVARASEGAAQVFPVKAADLMPEYQGPALGVRLNELEQRWIDSGFALTRDQLLR
ncbi:CCA tRNA nucleotidyltransferase [Lutimaribacter sp. EGI FJ00015]|uniref:CCA tRNA nucleotidyltransferase n=1 Tax=Lutimaribacter degradans TaxID=2945989 RepID=A0ACC5ZW11_9RHOB|nr:CCA tRNA nucleotidyltransferase [Lutimaribacter sp. EGI FJ00013]MCM2561951.1 CCA tRNA nucleotidyltransferase [Lutimaribacter sp. EGI FJ00013]MCO0613017.1 CCA tRNA nucleotidyltransferase [Lutimaribacter sp. EGI FJ00015]MCO0635783.1 CCA tRNA nucleotidyltransferase [Lutimaribacter sp. EGI FJ00014]